MSNILVLNRSYYRLILCIWLIFLLSTFIYFAWICTCLYIFIWDKVSICSPRWSEIYYVNKLSSDSQPFSCFSFLNDNITDMCHYAQVYYFLKRYDPLLWIMFDSKWMIWSHGIWIQSFSVYFNLVNKEKGYSSITGLFSYEAYGRLQKTE